MPDTNDVDYEIDTAAIAGDIASELFGDNSDNTLREASTEVTPPVQDAADPNPAAAPVSAADGPAPGTAAFDAMPKAWRKEMEAHWAKLPSEVRQYVHTREGDVSRGIQMYQQGHSQWNRLLQPYQAIFQNYPNLDPVALLQGVMSQHLQLAQGTPEQKRAVMVQLLKSYGLELPSGDASQEISASTEDPRIAELQSRLERQEALWTAAQSAAQQQAYSSSLQTVESFSKDPKNKYWDELVDDIHDLLRRNVVSNLPDAYETACQRNPAVRAKIIDEAVKSQTKAQVAPTPAAKFPNINGNASASRAKKMSLDETIDSVVSKHYPTH